MKSSEKINLLIEQIKAQQEQMQAQQVQMQAQKVQMQAQQEKIDQLIQIKWVNILILSTGHMIRYQGLIFLKIY